MISSVMRLGRTVQREASTGEVISMQFGGSKYAPRWTHAGTLRPVYLQELYGPEYIKKGFSWTPLDLAGPALNLVAGAVPGGSLIAGALGVTGGTSMSNGWGLGGNPCPAGTYCRGVPVTTPIGSTCIGSCVPLITTPALPELPGVPGIGPIYENGNGGGYVNGVGQMCCPSGKRPNKSDYFLKDGTFIRKGTKCVPYRRKNPLNPRAWNKAYRRLKSAESWAKKYATGPRRAHVKTTRKRK